jgi:hypothetical protein
MSSPVHRRAPRATPAALFVILVALAVVAVCAPAASAAGWENNGTGSNDQEVQHVTAVGATEAWAESSVPSAVLHTIDGSYWSSTGTANLPDDLEASSFFDATHGLVGNRLGQVSYTTDGSSWSSPVTLPLIPPANLYHYRAYDISFGDAQTAWIAPFNQSALLKTTDGGATWSDPAQAVPAGVTPNMVDALSATTCWAADGTHVIFTSDGGATWTKTTTDPPVPPARSSTASPPPTTTISGPWAGTTGVGSCWRPATAARPGAPSWTWACARVASKPWTCWPTARTAGPSAVMAW